MTNNTVLSDEQIFDIFDCHCAETREVVNTYELHAVVRAAEQALMQSPEIQGLIEDKKRLDWLESSEDSHGFCHAGFGDYIHYAHQIDGYPTVREVIDAAMEKQK